MKKWVGSWAYPTRKDQPLRQFFLEHQESSFSQRNNSTHDKVSSQPQNAKAQFLYHIHVRQRAGGIQSVVKNRVKACSKLLEQSDVKTFTNETTRKKRAMIYAERYLLRLVCVCVQHALFIIWFLKEERQSRIPWVNVQGIRPSISDSMEQTPGTPGNSWWNLVIQTSLPKTNHKLSRWWFQILCMFIAIWGNESFLMSDMIQIE